MILVFWEKNFKSMEADYSNHLAGPLVASCREIPPSPWICCDKIKSPYQRCQFLGTQRQATPRMWHNKTQPIDPKPASLEYARTWCLAWIRWEHWGCRRRQQRLLLPLASFLLASFLGRNYTNLRRARARTPRKSHGHYTLVLLAKASPLPFIAIRGLTKENPWTNSARFTDAFMAAFTDTVKVAIIQILQTVMSHVSTE